MTTIITVVLTSLINLGIYNLPQPSEKIDEYLKDGDKCYKWVSKVNNKGVNRTGHVSVVKCPKVLIGHTPKGRATLKARIRSN